MSNKDSCTETDNDFIHSDCYIFNCILACLFLQTENHHLLIAVSPHQLFF